MFRYCKKLSLFALTQWLIVLLLFSGSLVSCSIKNYPANKPFVFENKITIRGSIKSSERKRLSEELSNYWDDSLKANRLQQFGFLYQLRNPPVFEAGNLQRTKNFMNAYLNSQGYYYAQLTPSHKIKKYKNQQRVTVSMDIVLGKSIRIDSVGYNMFDTTVLPLDSTLQKLTLQQSAASLVKKGSPYTKQNINSELERLLSWYHQNGYYRFTKEDMYVLVDTLDARLLTLTLDPFKQAELIAEADKRRKENPAWNITFMRKMGKNPFALQQYYTGHIYYFPDIKNPFYTPDSIINQIGYLKKASRPGMTMYYSGVKFRFRPLREHTYLTNGTLYNEDGYYKTINRLTQMGTWKQVDIKPVIRGKDSIDLYVFMVQEKKQGFTIDQEFSRNTGDIGSGNLLGLATNFSYKNRNIWRQAIQSLTTLRFGVELNIDKQAANSLNQSLLQTTQVSLSHTYIFPRLIQPFKNWKAFNELENKRTLFTLAGGYTDRKNLYRLRSLVTNWGYEFSKGENNWLFKPINVELYKVDSLQGLDTLFKTNPFLRNSFRDGKVAGVSVSYSRTFNSKHHPNKSHYIRLGYEESGLLINQILGGIDNVFEYNKIEAEYRFIRKYAKDEFASRFFTGIGFHNSSTLPVFKQYFMGGPNSMRAWTLRQIGLGSSLSSDTTKSGYTDRFGDFTIETNFEYRFPIGSIAGVKIGSALFSDIGNVWNLKNNQDDPDASFQLKRIIKDLAIGVGTGVRVDFSYFLIRIDVAYKMKDPARLAYNGWVSPSDFEWTSTRSNGVKIRNYAIQLGIGLPF